MAEFTTRVRYPSDPLTSTVNGVSTDTMPDADYVYSWRSRRTNKDLGDAITGNNLGIKMPVKTGTVAERLADRKRFAEDIDRMAGSLINRAAGGQPASCLTDTGHAFTSIKYRTIKAARFVQRVKSTGVINFSSPAFAFPSAVRPNELSSTPGFASALPPAGLTVPGVLERNARLAPVFSEMRPSKEIAKIGETIVSLFRGEFPTIVKNLQKYADQMADMRKAVRKTAKYAGGEYLNSVFGWAPLIRDFEAAIKVLIAVDSIIYGSAYRRKRVIEWDHQIMVDSNVTSSRTAYLSTPQTPTAMANIGIERRWTLDYNIHLSARLVPFARPGLGANKFIDEAEEKIHQLGLWYPALGWDVLPYSWLIDWFTNLGASITNAQTYGTAPGMVNIDYAYATSRTTAYCEASSSMAGWVTVGTQERMLRGTAKTISIASNRFPVSPFGPGVDFSALKDWQVYILTALGIAKFL